MIFLLQPKGRRERSADIILLEKQKKEYDNYIALAAKVKQLIEPKRDKGIDVYTHESLNDKKVITGEQLKLLIEDHTGKNRVRKIVLIKTD